MGVMLEPYGGPKTRHRCPQCGRSGKFTRYINGEGEHLADDVGRCDREEQCGYHRKPKEFYQDNPRTRDRSEFKPRYKEPEKPIDSLPNELMMQTLRGYEQNNFFLFLRGLIGEDHARYQMRRYNVGTSRHWPGATVFWQVDAVGRVRQLKLMLYDPRTGKRVKGDTPAMKWDYISGQYREDVGGQDKSLIYGKFIQGGRFKNYNFQQCLFGEHFLRNDCRTALVESEKTAILASHYFPDLDWVATGGSNGAGFTKPNVCKVLQGRKVILFPDLGQYDKWTEKAKEMQRVVSCKVIVSNLLEANAGEIERENGYDLADYLIASNTPKMSHNDPGPPVEKTSERTIHRPKNWTPLEGFEGF